MWYMPGAPENSLCMRFGTSSMCTISLTVVKDPGISLQFPSSPQVLWTSSLLSRMPSNPALSQVCLA